MNEALTNVLQKLEQNGMPSQFVATAAEVVPAVKTLLTPGCCVATGGSQTLLQTGVMALLRGGDYAFLDRENPADSTPGEIQRRAFSADWFLCSANAITENGELYNVDGNGNRIAALAFGPAQVLVVAGINKLVPTLADAVQRVKTIAAPRNAVRLHCKTPCAVSGHCVSLDTGDGERMTAGCQSAARICCQYLVSGRQRLPGRIHVLLCGEPLGF